jgi:rhoptry neck protein 2
MKRIKNLVAISIFSLLVLGLPAIASAQNRDRDRDCDDNRNGNGGYSNGGYNNGGYSNTGYGNGQYGNYGNMRSIVRDLKNRTRDLQRQLDRDLDHSRYDGSDREDQINELAGEFKDAVNRLSESNNSYGNNGRNDDKIDRVLNLGSQLDRTLSRSGLSYNVQNIWSGIRYDLNALEDAYGYNDNNRNNRNNRRNRNGSGNGRWGNGGINKPSWWPF